MDKSILATAQLMIRPFIETTTKLHEDIIKEPYLNKEMPVPEQVIKERAKSDIEELQKFLLGEEELTLAEEGYELVLRELARLPEHRNVLEDLKKAAERLIENPDPSEDLEFQIYETLQEMFGISKESYDAMYKIGSDFFNQGKAEEALKIFVLLTTLNNLIFEPWLGLGSCWQMQNRFPEALQAFTMAALLNYGNPAPHLYTAEVYLQMGQKKLSKEIFTLALSKMDETQKLAFESHIKYLKVNLKRK